MLDRYTWGMMARAKLQGVCNVPNRTIFEGDNLDVMRGMNDGCVDLIYLDPPFNSNRDYAAPIGSMAAGAAFKDTWDLTDVDEAWHNEIAETDLALYKIIDASEQSHGRGMKSSVSIYLLRDPTASRCLKTTVDAVFGAFAVRNEVTWMRRGSKSHSNRRQVRMFTASLCLTESLHDSDI